MIRGTLVPPRYIVAISGHCSEGSIRKDNVRPSCKQLRACSDILSGALSGRPQQSYSSSFPNAVTSSSNPLAPVNSIVVHSQTTAQQFVKFRPQALSSLFSSCHVNNIQVFMSYNGGSISLNISLCDPDILD